MIAPFWQVLAGGLTAATDLARRLTEWIVANRDRLRRLPQDTALSASQLTWPLPLRKALRRIVKDHPREIAERWMAASW